MSFKTRLANGAPVAAVGADISMMHPWMFVTVPDDVARDAEEGKMI